MCGYVPSFLEKRNGRDPRSTGGETIGGVQRRNPSDGKHGDGDRAADFSEPLKALRRPECHLRRCGKDGAKKKIICAVARGGFCSFLRVTRHADQEILALGMCGRTPFLFLPLHTVVCKIRSPG